ncbi:MAG: hypothetical protein IKN43_10595 [Selenomonadaceae bacterium]|nr:hypothetical protein [Selenomonadaceae bacterium]
MGEVDEDTENFLNYVENKGIKGTFVKEVAKEVERLKAHDALKLEYMSLFAKMTDERDEGREEGERKGKTDMMLELLKAKQPLSFIAQISKFTVEQIAKIGRDNGIALN